MSIDYTRRTSAGMETRRNSTGARVSQEEKCLDCSRPVLDKEKGLQCEICELWFHARCQKVSEDTYKLLESNQAVHWFCSGCNRSVGKVLKALALVQARQDRVEEELEQVKTQIMGIKTELKTLGDLAKATDGLCRATDDKVKEVDTIVKSTDTKLDTMIEAKLVEGIERNVESKVNVRVQEVKDDVAEAMEIEKRKNNLVFHGVKEVVVDLETLGQSEGNKSGDQDKVEEILRVGLRVEASRHIEEVQRIGAYREGKIRPLRVRVKTFEGRNEILKRAKDLKEVLEFKQVFIAPDLTRKQQVVDKDLRERVKKFRTEGHQSVRIKSGKIIKNEPGQQVVVLYQPV